jgi:amino acid transporter
MTATQEAPTPKKHSTALKREVGLIGLMWASMGSIIGSGWLFAPKDALLVAGPSVLISWVIGGVMIVVLALVHAELGGMYPVSGGTARFPHYAYGGVAGASFGWFSWLQAATVAPIGVSAMLTYLGDYDFAKGWINPDTSVLSTTGILVSVVLMALFVAINFLGVRALANANSAITWWKVAIPLLTILVLAITNFDTGNLHAANGFANAGIKGIFSAIATGGIIFSYLGFEQADQLAGEASNPKRAIPLAIIGSMVLGPLIYLDAIISPAGTGIIYTTGSSRVAYGLSRNGYVPSVFELTNARGVPWIGLIAAFITGCICFLPFPSWQSLVGLITSASVLMYAGAPLSLSAFRKRLPDQERPFRLPAAGILSPIAFAVSSLIILWTTWDTDWKLGVAILIGYVILIGNRLLNLNQEHQPMLDWRAASWLPAYLVGMGVIVYISSFGPKANPVLPFGWDMVVTALFSFVIFYWAMQVCLSQEKIEQMMEEVVLPEEEGLAAPTH